MKPRAIVSWSGGKDCTLALWDARAAYDVRALVTTVTGAFGRISMHGVRIELLERQAAALGVPLETVALNYPCTNDEYETKMRAAFRRFQDDGTGAVVCGDIFLEDVRRYREEKLFGPEACVFPLWRHDSAGLARRFLDAGFRAVVCCVDTQVLAPEFAGRLFDADFLRDLPAGVDPCGENGEFHTFVFAGPFFSRPVAFAPGERVLREARFCYADLLPAAGYEPEA
jgi:uncharacterized protein (TIGR00290 family)